MDYVFKKYNTTQAQFDSSLVWYTRHTDQFATIYEKINKRYKKQLDDLNHLIATRDKKPQMSRPGDSIDVWYKERIYRLTNTVVSNKIKFDLTSDTNYKERDFLVWKMRYTFLPVRKNRKGDAVMVMSVRYDNDSLFDLTKKITASGLDSIVAKTDSSYRIKEITGFVYYPGQEADKALLLDKIQLMRYHAPKKEVVSDSMRVDSLKNDSMKLNKENHDTARTIALPPPSDSILPARRNPKDMNRRGNTQKNVNVRDVQLKQIKKLER